MSRLALIPVTVALLLAAPLGAAAVVIDSFESGNFSLSRWEVGASTAVSFPNTGHSISPARNIRIYHETGQIPPKPLATELVPLENVDDGAVLTFPLNENLGYIEFSWTGGPWDLTDNFTQNILKVVTSGYGDQTQFSVILFDGQDVLSHTVQLSELGVYKFDLWEDDDFDPTHVTEIYFRARSYEDDLTSFVLHDISTSSGSTYFMTYLTNWPRVYTWLCGPRGGGPTLGWDWAVGWPSQPTLGGPVLQIQGISGQGCTAVELEAEDSGGGGFGSVGLVTVDWQGSDFDNAMFEMDFTTNPSAAYTATLVGTPEVTQFNNGFSISHDVHVEHASGIPPGVVTQQLIVTPVPGQEIWLDYVQALPLGGPSGAGYSLSFAYTGSLFDPALPLLEMYTTSSFGDDAGAVGVPLPAVGAAGDGRSLRALPSVSRTGTRFVLAGESRGRSAIDVYDVTGRLVRRLEAHDGEADWDAADSRGLRVPAGVYFGRAEGVPRAARVVLIR